MKVICFSSYTSIWYSAFPEGIIGYELQKQGHQVVYITPGNEFPGKSNIINERIIRKEFALNGYDIGSVLSQSDRNIISRRIQKLNKNNFEKLILSGVNIGKISIYEFLLNRKKMTSSLSSQEWKICKPLIEMTLKSYYACKKILAREKPDRLIVYNALYSVNRIWFELAKISNIDVYFLGNGPNLSTTDQSILMAKNDSIYYMKYLKKIWKIYKDIPISREQANEVTNHLLELFKAKNGRVYSAPISKDLINIRKYFGIRDGQKVVTITMSSYDELFAASYIGSWKLPIRPLFSTQIEWIKEVIDYIKDKKNIFLIIRIHPREFPHKNNKSKSEHSRSMEKIFVDLPSNVRINWPSENISIYDLAKETNLFLNAWSTVGVEMSLLGIPVLIYSKDLIMYPSELNYLSTSKKEYFQNIEWILKQDNNFEKVRLTYRWLALSCSDRATLKYRYNRTIQNLISYRTIWERTLNVLYASLNPKLRTTLSKLLSNMPVFRVGDRQILDCREYINSKNNMPELSIMLSKSEPSLINIKSTPNNWISLKQEKEYIDHELKRIYKELHSIENN